MPRARQALRATARARFRRRRRHPHPRHGAGGAPRRGPRIGRGARSTARSPLSSARAAASSAREQLRRRGGIAARGQKARSQTKSNLKGKAATSGWKSKEGPFEPRSSDERRGQHLTSRSGAPAPLVLQVEAELPVLMRTGGGAGRGGQLPALARTLSADAPCERPSDISHSACDDMTC